MSFVTVGAALKQLLETVPNIQVVFDYEPDELATYPALTIQATGHTGEFRSTAHNQRSHSFMIRLYQTTISGRKEEAETEARELLDAIIATIDANPTLNGACSFATPSSSTIIPFADREVPGRAAEMTVVANSYVRRTP